MADTNDYQEQIIVWWASCTTTPKQGDKAIVEGTLYNFVDNNNNRKYEITEGIVTILTGNEGSGTGDNTGTNDGGNTGNNDGGQDGNTETTQEKCTITFYANGGTGNMTAVSVTKGTKYVVPACEFVAPDGREFKAWMFDNEVYNAGDEITVEEDVLFVALWKNYSGSGTSQNRGCGGSIIASSAIISLASFLGVGLLILKKKR